MVAPLACAAALGALLPDLDAAESKIKSLSILRVQPFYLPAVLIHRDLGHRGFCHSGAALAVLSLLAVPLAIYAGWQVYAALLLGYASHLAADGCTRSGIPFCYPRRKRYHLLPPAFRFVTGSLAEEALMPFLAVAVMLLLLRHLPLSQ
jgi:inner membrane protein